MKIQALGLTGGCVGVITVGILLSSRVQSNVKDPEIQCSEWEFSRDLGFEGGQAGAILSCLSPAGDWEEVPLQLLCSRVAPGQEISVRYGGGLVSDEVDPPVEPIELTYHVGEQVFVEQARYEGALGDWVVYKGVQDPLIEGLKKAETVVIESAGSRERWPLAGAASALTDLQRACGG